MKRTIKLALILGAATLPKMAISQDIGLITPLPMDQIAPARQYLSEYKPLKGYPVAEKLAGYKTITLTSDISGLSPEEKTALGYMIEAAKHADNVFWMQSYGHKDSVLSRTQDETLKNFMLLNYGPWDRLNDNAPFVEGIGPKPAGSTFYPAGVTKATLDSAYRGMRMDPYSVVLQNGFGGFEDQPYFMAYGEEIVQISENLRKAAIALGREKHVELFDYLMLRAEALMINAYPPSDIAWLRVKNESLDIIIGPIENYEDQLMGAKTAFEAYVLVRDKAWGAKLERYIKLLPDLQKNLPVPAEYKKEEVNNGNSQLAVFRGVESGSRSRKRKMDGSGETTNKEKVENESDHWTYYSLTIRPSVLLPFVTRL